ncbi:MAG TPA: hypothetical protein VEK84_10400 [Terriglobales bacterium]|nr:hypothetical protein [Terriglobales bacterium]
MNGQLTIDGGTPPEMENPDAHSWLFWIVVAVVLLYSFLAGVRTITDYDLGWQLATGRWIAQHHQIPSTDVFSFTARGNPWIYPALSGLMFYGVFLLGGYALLSWVGATACLGTVALLLRKGSAFSAALAVLAIPRIAARVTPRADLFTTVLFAAFLSILWDYFKTRSARLWILPVLMAAWVNLHLGFVAGLALMGAYVVLELTEMAFRGERGVSARLRLVRAWPYLLGSAGATLLNPWGWSLYRALIRQDEAMAQHAQWIGEWAPAPLSWAAASGIFTVRDTKGAFFALLALAGLAALVALWQRQPGSALLLTGAACMGIRHVRFQALFAAVVVVVAGSVFSTAWAGLSSKWNDIRVRSILAFGIASLLVLLVIARCSDLVSNRHYLGGTDTGTFGTGLSWWFPERAAEFIERNNLPGQIFNNYNLGGYLTWRLGPNYPDYIDGRAIPFGLAAFERQDQLLQLSPDAPDWQREADRFGLNTIFVTLARYDGAVQFLGPLCNSGTWRLAYLDEVSAVFVRRTSDRPSLAGQLQAGCSTAILPAQALSSTSSTQFQQWANAALVLHVLGRQSEALDASSRALRIFPDSANLHFIRAKILTALGRARQAQAECFAALELEPNDVTWASLADLYWGAGDKIRAVDAMRRAIALSSRPHLMLTNLGYSYLREEQPAEALRTFDEAERRAPSEAKENIPFQLDLARGRASAWSALGNNPQAIAFEERATRLVPDRSELWLELASLYELSERPGEAERARLKAQELKLADGNRR